MICRTRSFLGLLSVVLLGIAVVPSSGAEPERPNFLLILTDDHGWSQLSAAMHRDVPEAHSSYLSTPNIDRLAQRGMRFTNGYAPAPLCTPTRRSILCGTTAARSGGEFRSDWIPAQHLTIPRALKQADPAYRCAHFGKWGEQMISTPEQCGYDASDGMTGNNTGGMPTSLNPNIRRANHNNTAPFYTNQEDPKLTDHVTDQSMQFIKESVEQERPFFVQASYYAVHLSIVAREETVKKYEAKGEPDRGYSAAWAAMLEEMDTAIGRLLDTLDELEIAGNTYVVFTTDNGGRGTVPGGDAQRLPPNYPLTGAKHSLHEGGIRVPFIVRGPGVDAEAYCHTPVAGYDLLPTFYALAGGRDPLPEEVDGVSLQPLLADPEDGRVSREQGGLIFHRPARGVSAIRHGQHKLLLHWARDGSVAGRELFRFDPDPREEGRDIARREPAKADQLHRQLLNYLARVDAEKLGER